MPQSLPQVNDSQVLDKAGDPILADFLLGLREGHLSRGNAGQEMARQQFFSLHVVWSGGKTLRPQIFDNVRTAEFNRNEMIDLEFGAPPPGNLITRERFPLHFLGNAGAILIPPCNPSRRKFRIRQQRFSRAGWTRERNDDHESREDKSDIQGSGGGSLVLL